MEFTIENAESYINMHLTKIYEDTDDFEFCLNVKCGCFVIKDKIIYISRIELSNFYKKLNECFINLNGEIKSEFEYDEDVIIYLTFDKLGKVKISCDIFNYSEYSCKSHIEFESDQTFIAKTLNQLNLILS